jgi:hypothetical protein
MLLFLLNEKKEHPSMHPCMLADAYGQYGSATTDGFNDCGV